MPAIAFDTNDDGELTKEQVKVGQSFCDAESDHLNREVDKFLLSQEEKGSPSTFECALDVIYLRTRSRWTQELEDRLIREHSEGKSIKICEWPSEL